MSKITHLGYHLDQYGRNFIFQIEEQSDQVVNFIKRVGVFEASNGWRVMIDKQPEIDLDNKVIYLQGRKSGKDDYIHRNQKVGPEKEVKKICGAIDRALAEMVKEAKCGTRRPFKTYDTMVIDLSEFDMFAPVRRENRIIIYR